MILISSNHLFIYHRKGPRILRKNQNISTKCSSTSCNLKTSCKKYKKGKRYSPFYLMGNDVNEQVIQSENAHPGFWIFTLPGSIRRASIWLGRKKCVTYRVVGEDCFKDEKWKCHQNFEKILLPRSRLMKQKQSPTVSSWISTGRRQTQGQVWACPRNEGSHVSPSKSQDASSEFYKNTLMAHLLETLHF